MNLSSITNDCAKAIEDFFSHSDIDLPIAIRESLVLDICYFFFRHRRWSKAPLLETIATDFFQEQYQLAPQLTDEIIHFAKELLWKDTLQNGDSESNEEFIQFLFIQIISCKNFEEVSLDLCISKEFLNFIKIAVQGDFEPSALPSESIEAQIVQLVGSLREEQKMTPWVIDLFRLKYSISAPLQDRKELDSLFHLLLDIGKKTGGTLERDLNEKLKSFHEKRLDLESLVEEGLIYAHPEGRKVYYSLTKLGIQLTQKAFAQKFARSRKGTPEALLDLPLGYMTETFKIFPLERLNQLTELLERYGSRIPPDSWEAAIQRLLPHSNHQRIFDLVSAQLSSERPDFAKLKLIKCLENLSNDPRCQTFLEKFSLSDHSWRLKEAALHVEAKISQAAMT